MAPKKGEFDRIMEDAQESRQELIHSARQALIDGLPTNKIYTGEFNPDRTMETVADVMETRDPNSQ